MNEGKEEEDEVQKWTKRTWGDAVKRGEKEKVWNEEETKKTEFFLYGLTLEDGLDRLSRNVGNITTILRCMES